MFLVALMLAFPQAAPAQADHDARVERFIAALPPSSKDDGQDDGPDFREQELEALIGTNAGKEAAIRQVIAARRKCTGDFTSSYATGAIRRAATTLTDAELDQLTAFYSGPEYKAMVAAGPKADMAALMKRYPLGRFMEASQKVPAEAPTEVMDGLFACDAAADAALAEAGVKSE
jgi:hypothetical protein